MLTLAVSQLLLDLVLVVTLRDLQLQLVLLWLSSYC